MLKRNSECENNDGNATPDSKMFTLIELMVVVLIITILMAMLLPALSRAKYMAKNTLCMSQLKQIATAWVSYGSDNNNRFYDYGPSVDQDLMSGSAYNAGPRPLREWVAAKAHSGTFAHVNFDPRPTLREYTGPLNDLMVCPLANPNWFTHNGYNDKTDPDGFVLGWGESGAKTSYMIYPTRQLATRHFYTKRPMKTVGSEFTLWNLPARKESGPMSIIASDFMKVDGWGEPVNTLFATQMPYLGNRTPASRDMDHMMRNTSWRVEPGTSTYANYVLGDGSVVTYTNVSPLDFQSGRFLPTWGTGSFMLPKDLED